MLYTYRVWSKDGMRISRIRYFLIEANEATIMEMIRYVKPGSLERFLTYLHDMHIKVDEVMPVSLDDVDRTVWE